MAPGLAGITVEPTVFRPADYLTTALHDLGVVGIVALVALFAGLAVVLFQLADGDDRGRLDHGVRDHRRLGA